MAAKKKKVEITDERKLALEIEAAKIVRATITELMGGENSDPDLVRDMVEGETDIRTLLETMIDNEARDEEMLTGIDARLKALGSRKARIENRIDKRRTLMLTAMQLAEIDKHECAEGTISLRATAVQAEVTEEADIPAEFFIDPPPRLDKRALLEKLKDIEAENEKIIEEWKASGANEPPKLKSIPGAALKPAGKTVSIR